MNIIWVLGLLVYVVFIGSVLFFWKKKSSITSTPPLLRISIVIAFRNEEKKLTELIESLSKLDYPKELVELILVNDHSHDKSVEIISKSNSLLPLVLLHLPEGKEGKKAALTFGINYANHPWIVTTDADCQVHSKWLLEFSAAQQTTPKKMWCGRVYYFENSTWDTLLAHEFTSVMALGGACIQAGFPTMSNGANLMFEKATFLELGGYEAEQKVRSGDDEFLMHRIHNRYPGSIGFINKKEHTIYTHAAENWKSLLHQRIRWAGKWKHYRNPASTWLAVFTLLLQVYFLSLPFLYLQNYLSGLFLGVILGGKLLVDSIFIHTLRKDFERSLNFSILLCLEVGYPIYVLLIGIVSQFKGYSWKGRNGNDK